MSMAKDPLTQTTTDTQTSDVTTTSLELPVVYPDPKAGGGLSNRLEVDTQSDHVVVTYQFEDHKGNQQTAEFRWEKTRLFELIQRHGLPKEIRTRWQESHAVTREEQKTLKQELMALAPYYIFAGDWLKPPNGSPWCQLKVDRLIADHAAYCKDIAEYLVGILDSYQTDTPLERVELAMSFVGWIPYGAPIHEDKSREYGGILTPAGCLVHRFADCDSKRYLLAGILAYLIEHLDLRWAYAPGHGYDVVGWAEREPGMAVLEDDEGTKYVVADATTPRRFGEPNGHVEASSVNRQFSVPSDAVVIPRRSHSATLDPDYHRRYPTLVQELNDLRSSGTTIRRLTFDSGPGWVVLGGVDKVSQDVRAHAAWEPRTFAFIRDYSQVYKGPYNEYFLQVLETADKGQLKIGSLSGSPAFADLVSGFNTIVAGSPLGVQHVSCAPLCVLKDPVTDRSYFKFPFVIVHGTDACTYGYLTEYEADLQAQWGEGYCGLTDVLESEKKHGLRCVVLSRFGWVVVSGNNQTKMSLIPELAQPLSQMCQRISNQGLAIQHIAISDAGDWIILYGKNSYALSWGDHEQKLMTDIEN